MNRIPEILMWLSGFSYAFLVFFRCLTIVFACSVLFAVGAKIFNGLSAQLGLALW